jgi:hypothetical protein
MFLEELRSYLRASMKLNYVAKFSASKPLPRAKTCRDLSLSRAATFLHAYEPILSAWISVSIEVDGERSK